MTKNKNLQSHLETTENSLGGEIKQLKDLGEHLEYIDELLVMQK